MKPLGARIAALIAAQGPISIAEYMTLALHDPREGYYATRDPLGAAGDFITAPEVSQMFGELIGLWLAQCWVDQGRPARPTLVELGPGRGTLMADALRALALVPALRAQIAVALVETSPVLAAAQRETLAGIDVPVRWVEGLDAVDAQGPMFVVANEFFDALPVRQYVRNAGAWHERMVTLEGDALAFAASPVPIPSASLPFNRADAPQGGVYETSPAGAALVEDIAHRIARQGGAALLVDYGYATPGFGETLQAMTRHRPAPVLAHPGGQDLTAHVDFEALREAAERGGARACGPLAQGAFLTALGIVRRAETLGDSPVVQRQLERLILPTQMGELFKALAIVPKGAPTPPGF